MGNLLYSEPLCQTATASRIKKKGECYDRPSHASYHRRVVEPSIASRLRRERRGHSLRNRTSGFPFRIKCQQMSHDNEAIQRGAGPIVFVSSILRNPLALDPKKKMHLHFFSLTRRAIEQILGWGDRVEECPSSWWWTCVWDVRAIYYSANGDWCILLSSNYG